VREVEAFLAEAIATVEAEAPGASVRARWTRFEQIVLVTTPDGEVAGDHRSGGWLRLEGRRGAARAVAERPLSRPPGDLGRDACATAARRLARDLHRRASARAPRPGPTAIVFAPGAGGVLVHEIVGHALEADTILGGGSWLAGRRRERIAAPGVLVVDDPRRGRAPWAIDDEGAPTRAVPLVRAGTFAGALHDRGTARASGEAATGHGRRASYRHPVLPRMGCTFVAAGRLAPEEVVEAIESGVYVRSLEAASTDVRTGRATFRVVDADAIEHGTRRHALEPFLLAVDGAEALLGMVRIASDLAFDTCVGSCIRAGQPLSTSVGGPTFCIGSATILP
jgi:TldD protein